MLLLAATYTVGYAYGKIVKVGAAAESTCVGDGRSGWGRNWELMAKKRTVLERSVLMISDSSFFFESANFRHAVARGKGLIKALFL